MYLIMKKKYTIFFSFTVIFGFMVHGSWFMCYMIGYGFGWARSRIQRSQTQGPNC